MSFENSSFVVTCTRKLVVRVSRGHGFRYTEVDGQPHWLTRQRVYVYGGCLCRSSVGGLHRSDDPICFWNFRHKYRYKAILLLMTFSSGISNNLAITRACHGRVRDMAQFWRRNGWSSSIAILIIASHFRESTFRFSSRSRGLQSLHFDGMNLDACLAISVVCASTWHQAFAYVSVWEVFG